MMFSYCVFVPWRPSILWLFTVVILMTYLLFFVVFLSDVVWLLVFLFYDVLAIAFLYDNVCLCILCRFAIAIFDWWRLSIVLYSYTIFIFVWWCFPYSCMTFWPLYFVWWRLYIVLWRFAIVILSDDTYPLFYDVSLKNFCLMMFFYHSMTFWMLQISSGDACLSFYLTF